jgi:hypothetical protein
VQPQRAGVQRSRDGIEDVFGDTRDVTLLQPGVPIGAHAREDSHLLAAQTGDPAPPARGKAHLAWGDFGASGGEEVPDLGAAVHAFTIRAGDHAKGVELVPPTSSAFLATVSGGEVGTTPEHRTL